MQESIRLKKAVAAALTVLFICLVVLFQGSSQAATSTAGDGADTYKAKCVACHAADGSGTTNAGKAMKLRDLRSAEVQKQSDDQLYNLIAKGKGKMPGYEKSLGADKCKELVAYVRRLAGK